MREISAKDVRWQLTEVLNEVSFREARYLITKNGRPTAVLIGVNDYNNLVDQDDRVIADAARSSSADDIEVTKLDSSVRLPK